MKSRSRKSRVKKISYESKNQHRKTVNNTVVWPEKIGGEEEENNNGRRRKRRECRCECFEGKFVFEAPAIQTYATCP